MRAFPVAAARVLAHPRDAWLLAAAGVHVALLVAIPHPVVAGMLFWWTANTVAHNFIHNPFFRDRRANACASAALSLLLGVPQSLWRARHRAHHAERVADLRRAPGLMHESALVVLWWTALIALVPGYVAAVLAPGLALGLVLCWLQGHHEHVRGVTGTDGRLYNTLFFNDGLHPEHHARPGMHWSELASAPRVAARRSAYPAVLRWLETHPLDALERIALASEFVQRRVLVVHERAIDAVLRDVPDVHSVVIVGGGLFPRTAILLRRLLPAARIVVVDREQESLDAARLLLPDGVETVCAEFDPDVHRADLVVLPLAFVGDRDALACDPRVGAMLVHDWVWVRRERSALVAWWLLKRINLTAGGGAS